VQRLANQLGRHLRRQGRVLGGGWAHRPGVAGTVDHLQQAASPAAAIIAAEVKAGMFSYRHTAATPQPWHSPAEQQCQVIFCRGLH
jgi:hypothetical protein